MRSRRDFLRAAAILAGVLPVSRSRSSFGSDTVSLPSLHSRLSKRRSAVRTLHVDFEYKTPRPDILAGRNQMYYSRGLYHLRHVGENVTIVQIVQVDRVLNAVVVEGVVGKVTVRSRTRRDPGASLDTFLPQPEDKPMVSRGYREIRGDRCQGVLQADHCYWISTTLNATRAVEIFDTAEKVKEVLTFDDFAELSSEVVFPRLIRINSLNEEPRSQEKSIQVSSVVLNEPVSNELFDIERFPRSGERIVLQ